MVVLVRVAGQNAADAAANHFLQGVLGQVGVAGAVEDDGDDPGKPAAPTARVDGEPPGVTAELTGRWLSNARRAEKVEAERPGRW
jgi:hypothetical protein